MGHIYIEAQYSITVRTEIRKEAQETKQLDTIPTRARNEKDQGITQKMRDAEKIKGVLGKR